MLFKDMVFSFKRKFENGAIIAINGVIPKERLVDDLDTAIKQSEQQNQQTARFVLRVQRTSFLKMKVGTG